MKVKIQTKMTTGQAIIGTGFIIFFIIYIVFSSDYFSNIPSKSPIILVYNNSLTGSVYQVKQYVKDNAKDPSSIKFTGWSPVTNFNEGYLVRCDFSGINSFGARVPSSEIFFISADGKVRVY